METFRPQSAAVRTVLTITAVALIGVIVNVILTKTQQTPWSGGYGYDMPNPYINALQPLLFAGLPILMLAGFIYGIFSVSREETRLGRIQLTGLLVIIVVLAYLQSFLMFPQF